jgi:hypothetical protein
MSTDANDTDGTTGKLTTEGGWIFRDETHTTEASCGMDARGIAVWPAAWMRREVGPHFNRNKEVASWTAA